MKEKQKQRRDAHDLFQKEEDISPYELTVDNLGLRPDKYVTPRPNELFLDIDSDADMQHFQEWSDRMWTFIGIEDVKSEKTEHGTHVTVILEKPIGMVERICLQAMLGSDRKREALSYCRWRLKMSDPVLFGEKGWKSRPRRFVK